MKTKHKILIIVTIIVVFLLLGFVGSYILVENTSKEVDVYTNTIYDEIYCKIEYTNVLNQMVEITSEEFEYNYNIEADMIEDYTIYVPSIKVKADEIAIVKVKDLKYVNEVKNSFQKRADNIADTFVNYVENEYLKAKNPIIINRKQYVFLVISDYNNEIEKIINDYFKN